MMACFLSFVSQAYADDAAAWFQRGRTLADAGDAAGSYDAFVRSHAITPNYDAAGNASQQAAYLKRWPEACNLANYSLSHLPVSMVAERRAAVSDSLRAVLQQTDPHVGRIRVETTDGAEVFVNGAVVGRMPLDPPAYCLATGQHELRATLPGFEPSTQAIEVRAGETTVVSLRLTNKQTVPLAPAPTQAEASTGPDAAVIVPLAVIAAAGIGTGIGLLVAGSATHTDGDERLAALPQANPCISGGVNEVECSTIGQLYDNAATLEAGGAVALALGGAVAVSTVVYALWPRDEAAEELSWLVQPLAGPSLAGVALSGSF